MDSRTRKALMECNTLEEFKAIGGKVPLSEFDRALGDRFTYLMGKDGYNEFNDPRPKEKMPLEGGEN
ncbi:hypothetical protein [Gracilibacillus alcaliphilus]|uniref:hypothetical protein n=1 Tax=Gracilibacillus alcaliphilus TaxID=1401441 RepID=UPI0019568430|nr:hypothetical protein [Gracilibacillus alcaliphilus]MBM7678963.1 hypothetical protein [Gracilibacillus alcaliphilus]